MTTEPAKALRADARLNHDRLLIAAADAFARNGADASLKAIAADAGVGIGTLYRRFPNRELLVEAVYRSETAGLCAAADSLLAEADPTTALRSWMDRFLRYLATKKGMADALKSVLAGQDELGSQTRQMLLDALTRLLEAGAATGAVRDDVAPLDVLMSLGGVALIANGSPDGELAGRLLDLLLAGLLVRP